MPMYSHSRLSVYETCPRQYRFRYVERVKVPELETVEMFCKDASAAGFKIATRAAA